MRHGSPLELFLFTDYRWTIYSPKLFHHRCAYRRDLVDNIFKWKNSAPKKYPPKNNTNCQLEVTQGGPCERGNICTGKHSAMKMTRWLESEDLRVTPGGPSLVSQSLEISSRKNVRKDLFNPAQTGRMRGENSHIRVVVHLAKRDLYWYNRALTCRLTYSARGRGCWLCTITRVCPRGHWNEGKLIGDSSLFVHYRPLTWKHWQLGWEFIARPAAI